MGEMLDVLLLTREGCHFCRDAEALLGRLGADYPLRVRIMDMASAEGERIALDAGLIFPPGIVLEGRPLGYGRPSEGKFRRAVEQLLAQRASHPEHKPATTGGR